MRKPTVDEGLENGREKRPENDDIPEDIILLPERETNSVAHVASPHLADPDQAKDFEMRVFSE